MFKRPINVEEEIKKFEQGFAYRPPEPTYLYHATSGPLDYYHGYKRMLMMGHDLYKDEMDSNSTDCIEAVKGMQMFTRLLFQVIEHFHKEFKWPRGEPIYYRFHHGCVLEPPSVLLVFKEDNNGTMHAFSTSKEALEKAPHDFECEWEIEDRVQIKDHNHG